MPDIDPFTSPVEASDGSSPPSPGSAHWARGVLYFQILSVSLAVLSTRTHKLHRLGPPRAIRDCIFFLATAPASVCPMLLMVLLSRSRPGKARVWCLLLAERVVTAAHIYALLPAVQ